MGVRELGAGGIELDVHMAVTLLPLAYIIGSPAALLAGFLYAVLALRGPDLVRRSLWRAVASGVIGGITAGLSGSLLFGTNSTIALPGVAAGVGCGLLVRFKDPVSERPIRGFARETIVRLNNGARDA